MPSPFPGFSKEAIDFLKGLRKNNKREWFQARKEIFDRAVKAPMELMVEAINSHMVKFAPQYITEPKKAVYRIYRDTRFSTDKTPYKTHVAASLTRAGMERHISAGYYFSVSPDQIEVAGGIYMPGPDQLRQIRDFLCEHHAEFRNLATDKKLVKVMGEMHGDAMSRVPKGYPADHPAGDLLKRKHWFFYDTRMDPKLLTSQQLVPEIVKRFRLMTPFIEGMNRPLTRKRSKDPLLS